MSHSLLFLLGGSAAFDIAADALVPACGGDKAHIALLLQGGPNWGKYVPEYVRPWTRRGVERYDVVVPDENGELDPRRVADQLERTTGIFVGGGNTAIYRRLYATEPLRSLIKHKYTDGIPFAGCSAGALIAPAICAFHPGESDNGLPTAEGLGLVDNFVVGVHFSAQDVLPHLLHAMAASRTATAWGIGDASCLVFRDGELEQVLGPCAYKVTMTDLTHNTYQIQEIQS